MDGPKSEILKLEPVDVRDLVDGQVFADKTELLEMLRNAIASGALGLGTQIPNERELANATGLSRSSVRAALDKLVHEGRLIRHVGRGTFVIDTGTDTPTWVDPAAISPAEILAARTLFEPTLPALIVMHASDTELSTLEKFALEGRLVAGWRDAEFFDSRFHFLLHEATGNAVIKDVGRFLSRARKGSAWKRIKEQRFNPVAWGSFQKEHENIATALVTRDAELASKLLSEHLCTVRMGMQT